MLGQEYLLEMLLSAIGENDLSQLKSMIDLGADLSKKGTDEEQPLHFAASIGRNECIKILIENGANIQAVSFNGTALHIASKNGHLATVKYFVEETDLNIDIKDYTGMTPLHYASYGGHTDIIKYLLSQGAKVNPETANASPLHSAAISGEVEAVKTLLENNANINSIDKTNGRTPFDVAANEKIEVLLKQYAQKEN